jgi:hypothetical protein
MQCWKIPLDLAAPSQQYCSLQWAELNRDGSRAQRGFGVRICVFQRNVGRSTFYRALNS